MVITPAPWRWILAGLLTCVIALYNHFPLTYPDSGNYLQNAYAIARGHRPWFFYRPVTYGAFLLPFAHGNTLWLIPLLQGALVAWVVDLALRVAAVPLSSGAFLVLFAGLSAVSSLPWFTGQIMPDVFTAVVILLGFVSLSGVGRQPAAERWIAGAVLALAIASHLSHVPLYAILAAAGLGWRLRMDPSARTADRLPALLVPALAPLMLALAFLAGTNRFFHGETVLSRSAALFSLAHLTGEGLTQRYLDRVCPEAGYLLCAEDSLPASLDWFLWDTDGPWRRHQPAMELGDSTFLHQAGAIVAGTLRQEWPAAVAGGLRGMLVQLGTFALHPGELAYSATVDRALGRLGPGPQQDYRDSRQVRGELPLRAAGLVHYTAVGIALLVLLVSLPALRGPAHAQLRALVSWIALGVLANALVIASLARVHPRYQSRVIWLVPLAAAAALIASRARAAPASRSASAQP